ncbi:MAG TPA: HYR domain-containing protein, partial [Pyrinomonadaceae bacterium]|nr:HYR domain-containing protein [Pyrinomonadaceae bacterium]
MRTLAPPCCIVVVATLVLSALFSNSPNAHAQICLQRPAGIIAWWPADGEANDIIGANHGVLQNGATFVAGKVGRAFSFNGLEAAVTLPPTSLHEAFSALSVEAWVYPLSHGRDAVSGVGYYGRTIISNTDSDGFALRVIDGFIQSDLRLTSGEARFAFYQAQLPLNQWSHVALTYGDGQLKAYLNGQMLGSVAVSGTIKNINNANVCAMIGNEPIGSSCAVQARGFGWHGGIDEVDIFDRALDAAEILALYNAGSAGKCNDLLPPSTTAGTSPSANTAGWNNTDVTVTLHANDGANGSGVKELIYSASGAQSIPATSVSGDSVSISITTEGTTTITYQAVDQMGNAESLRTATINIDKVAPAIECPADISTTVEPGQCSSAGVSYAVAATDNNPAVTVISSPASGTVFPVGTTVVTSVATDAAGNASTCTFTVTVNDKEGPVLECPASIVTSTAPGMNSAVVDYPLTARDNCPGVTLLSSPPSGSTFPKGTTTVTSTATDASGNTSTCTFSVTVNDTEKPKISCPADIVTTLGVGQSTAVVNYNVTATDNSSDVTINSDPPSGTAFPVGTTRVTSTATDDSGNTSTCSFTVTVNDVEKPSIACPANIVTSTDSGKCSAVVSYTVTATDNSPGVTVVSDPPSGSTFPKGTTNVTSIATDTSGNTSACTFTVTVNDNEKPLISCPANLTAPATSAAGVVVTYSSPSATDNCQGVTVVSNPPSGSVFPVGTTTVTATATDASGKT